MLPLILLTILPLFFYPLFIRLWKFCSFQNLFRPFTDHLDFFFVQPNTTIYLLLCVHSHVNSNDKFSSFGTFHNWTPTLPLSCWDFRFKEIFRSTFYFCNCSPHFWSILIFRVTAYFNISFKVILPCINPQITVFP